MQNKVTDPPHFLLVFKTARNEKHEKVLDYGQTLHHADTSGYHSLFAILVCFFPQPTQRPRQTNYPLQGRIFPGFS